jgi:hypothetical protein
VFRQLSDARHGVSSAERGVENDDERGRPGPDNSRKPESSLPEGHPLQPASREMSRAILFDAAFLPPGRRLTLDALP